MDTTINSHINKQKEKRENQQIKTRTKPSAESKKTDFFLKLVLTIELEKVEQASPSEW